MKWLTVFLAGGALIACDISRPIQDQHATVQRAPASADSSDDAKQDALRRTVAMDLGCDSMQIVLVLERRFVNSAVPRYVVEACGTRALYAETCESYPSCRYVMLSALPLPQAVVGPSAMPPPPPPPPMPMPAPSAGALPDPFPDAGPRFL